MLIIFNKPPKADSNSVRHTDDNTWNNASTFSLVSDVDPGGGWFSISDFTIDRLQHNAITNIYREKINIFLLSFSAMLFKRLLCWFLFLYTRIHKQRLSRLCLTYLVEWHNINYILLPICILYISKYLLQFYLQHSRVEKIFYSFLINIRAQSLCSSKTRDKEIPEFIPLYF